MNLILAIPIPVRLLLLFVLGACIGSFLNLAIYRLAWRAREISPWSRRSGKLAASWLDRVPIAGWLHARRMSRELGRAFWIRPLLVELGTGILFAWLYWWEVDQGRLVALFRGAAPAIPWPPPGGVNVALHLTFQSHAILLCLMIVASFIDIDDRIIPDAITIPGTLAGLVLAGVFPWSLLPDAAWVVPAGGAPTVLLEFVKLTSPNPWPADLDWPGTQPLWFGCACYWGWCVALMPRHWRARRGLQTAGRIFVRRLVSEPITYLLLTLAVLGTPLIYLTWWVGGPHWAGLLTALVGLAASGGLVWIVRIIGSAVLQREAMGFGDVTLMAMIGSFLGWQAGVLVFFAAPFCALLVGLAYLILRRDPEIFFGPFLCLGALAIIVRWSSIWIWAQPLFGMGTLFVAVIAGGFVMLAALLFALQLAKRLFRRS